MVTEITSYQIRVRMMVRLRCPKSPPDLVIHLLVGKYLSTKKWWQKGTKKILPVIIIFSILQHTEGVLYAANN